MCRREHIEVLKTLKDTGLLSRQAMKSIRGQLFSMSDEECEEYLKKIISRSRRKLTNTKSVIL